jgi:hypothetical protein|tara:strand:- start:15200 stop:15409 length:210 start_codon:yes stop_codon:yes gene_type:complete
MFVEVGVFAATRRLPSQKKMAKELKELATQAPFSTNAHLGHLYGVTGESSYSVKTTIHLHPQPLPEHFG